MTDKYILLGREVVPATLMEWALWLESPSNDRVVARHVGDRYAVSTVFLGLDHSFWGDPPLLFETMVFEEAEWVGVDMDRCSTYDEAEIMHVAMVQKWDPTARLVTYSPPTPLPV